MKSYPFYFLLCLCFVFVNCSSDDDAGEGTQAVLPQVNTNEITNVNTTSVTASGEVLSQGSTTVTEKGVIWSTGTEITISLSTKTNEGGGVGAFTSTLTELTPGTVYYLKAYAKSEAGVAYGETVSFTTEDTLVPTLITNEVTDITAFSAVSGGAMVQSESPVLAKGIVWSDTPSPTVTTHTGITESGTGTGDFSEMMTGLLYETTYYVRAYATNEHGTGYGNEKIFTITESGITSLNCNEASVDGTLTAGSVSDATLSVPYSGGNGGSYNELTVPSTGVTGLTATLGSGIFENGNGTLVLQITGTPDSEGTAIFALAIGGAECVIEVVVNPGIDSLYLGSYTVTQVGTGAFGYSVWEEGTVVVFTLDGSSTQRVFQIQYLPDAGLTNPPADFSFVLNNGEVIVPTNQYTGLACPPTGYVNYGPAPTGVTSTYNETDDSEITLIFTDNEDGACDDTPNEVTAILTKN